MHRLRSRAVKFPRQANEISLRVLSQLPTYALHVHCSSGLFPSGPLTGATSITSDMPTSRWRSGAVPRSTFVGTNGNIARKKSRDVCADCTRSYPNCLPIDYELESSSRETPSGAGIWSVRRMLNCRLLTWMYMED